MSISTYKHRTTIDIGSTVQTVYRLDSSEVPVSTDERAKHLPTSQSRWATTHLTEGSYWLVQISGGRVNRITYIRYEPANPDTDVAFSEVHIDLRGLSRLEYILHVCQAYGPVPKAMKAQLESCFVRA